MRVVVKRGPIVECPDLIASLNVSLDTPSAVRSHIDTLTLFGSVSGYGTTF